MSLEKNCKYLVIFSNVLYFCIVFNLFINFKQEDLVGEQYKKSSVNVGIVSLKMETLVTKSNYSS